MYSSSSDDVISEDVTLEDGGVSDDGGNCDEASDDEGSLEIISDEGDEGVGEDEDAEDVPLLLQEQSATRISNAISKAKHLFISSSP